MCDKLYQDENILFLFLFLSNKSLNLKSLVKKK